MPLHLGTFAQDPPEIEGLDTFVQRMDELGIDVWRDKVYPEEGEPFWTLDIVIGGKVGVDRFFAKSSVSEQFVADDYMWDLAVRLLRQELVAAIERHYGFTKSVRVPSEQKD